MSEDEFISELEAVLIMAEQESWCDRVLKVAIHLKEVKKIPINLDYIFEGSFNGQYEAWKDSVKGGEGG